MKPIFESYPAARITTDVIVDDNGQILLIKRGEEPYKGKWALPGGHFNPYDFNGEDKDQSILDCAKRELREETKVIADKLIFLNYYDNPNRHPSARVVNFAFVHLTNGKPYVTVGTDAVDYMWAYISDLKKGDLAFDHWEILKDYEDKKDKLGS